MGMYTEVLVKADIKSDISSEANAVLEYLFGEGEKPEVLPEHEFFSKARWQHIGNSCSYYHIPQVFNFYGEDYLFSRSDLKDYDGEAESFFDWLIRDCVDTDCYGCVGYHWHEEEEKPTLVVVGEDKS